MLFREKGVETPPSLVNIYQELHDDLGCAIPEHGCLTKWAEQGVLMLNTVLTVRAISQFTQGNRLGRIYRCRDHGFEWPGQAYRIHSMGEPGSAEGKNAE